MTTFHSVLDHVRSTWPDRIIIERGYSASGLRKSFNSDQYEDLVETPYRQRPDRSFLGECMNWAIFSVLPRDCDTTVTIDDLDKNEMKRLFDRNVRAYVENDLPEEPEHERDMDAYEYVQSLDR